MVFQQSTLFYSEDQLMRYSVCVCVSVCCRAVQPSRVGDDVCDVPVSGGCHRLHL